MVRINKIGKKFGLQCELCEYLAPSVRCLARRLGGPGDVGVAPRAPRGGQRGQETSWQRMSETVSSPAATCRGDGAGRCGRGRTLVGSDPCFSAGLRTG